MKKSVVIILFLSTAVTSLVTAQKTALEYLKTVPGNPDSVCVCLIFKAEQEPLKTTWIKIRTE